MVVAVSFRDASDPSYSSRVGATKTWKEQKCHHLIEVCVGEACRDAIFTI